MKINKQEEFNLYYGNIIRILPFIIQEHVIINIKYITRKKFNIACEAEKNVREKLHFFRFRAKNDFSVREFGN